MNTTSMSSQIIDTINYVFSGVTTGWDILQNLEKKKKNLLSLIWRTMLKNKNHNIN